jgi:hypothetical protein
MSPSVITFPIRNFKFLTEGSLEEARNYQIREKEFVACRNRFPLSRIVLVLVVVLEFFGREQAHFATAVSDAEYPFSGGDPRPASKFQTQPTEYDCRVHNQKSRARTITTTRTSRNEKPPGSDD